MRFLTILFVFALQLVFLAPLPTVSAQGTDSFLDIFAGRAPAENEATPEEKISPEEQLERVGKKLEAAEETLQEFQSEEFLQRIESSGMGVASQQEFIGVAESLVSTWNSAQAILLAMQVREQGSEEADPEVPTPPSDIAAATAMERLLEQKKTERIKLEFDLQAARDLHMEAEQNRRLARQELAGARQERTGSDDAQVRLRTGLRELLAEKRIDLAEARLLYLQWLRENQQRSLTSTQAEIDALQEALDQSGLNRILEASRAENHMAILEERKAELETLSAEVSELFTRISEEIQTARAAAEAAEDGGEGQRIPELLAVFSSVEFLQEIIQARLLLLERENNLWQSVSKVVGDPSLEELRELRLQTEETLQAMPSYFTRLEARISEARASSEALQQELGAPALSAQKKSLLEQRQKINQQLVEQLLLVKAELTDLEGINVRLQEELVDEIAGQSLGEKLRVTLLNFWSGLGKFWNYLLIDTEDRSVTLGTVVIALFGLIFAIFAARFLSVRISRSATRRFHLAPSQTHLLQKLALYAFSVVLILTILQWLQIPLTVFAFLGGALAVGIGFGSQNLINNFISGLILLFERMVNVGDLVEVDGNFGKVINLGSRCSTIQKFDGVEVLVPNSSLLEKNVTNWTLSDPQHRFDILVGVAYGSDLELVFKTLTEAMKEQPELLSDPAPEVAFEDFGASSLDFRLYYWVTLTACSARQVATQLRARIDRLCRERGIEIAFPQQDVHLHVPDPIPIQQLPTPKNSGPSS